MDEQEQEKYKASQIPVMAYTPQARELFPRYQQTARGVNTTQSRI
jgi:hypothetical protein